MTQLSCLCCLLFFGFLLVLNIPFRYFWKRLWTYLFLLVIWIYEYTIITSQFNKKSSIMRKFFAWLQIYFLQVAKSGLYTISLQISTDKSFFLSVNVKWIYHSFCTHNMNRRSEVYTMVIYFLSEQYQGCRNNTRI